jgi:putative ABC transport system substrate-binding protein
VQAEILPSLIAKQTAHLRGDIVALIVSSLETARMPMATNIRRRKFITALCAAAAAWPWNARAQGETRRIGVLMAPDSPDYVSFFVEALSKLGWIEGRNVHIDYRKSNADSESLRAAAADLVALRPDVIFAPGLSFVAARTQTQTLSLVFTQITAPVERGFVASLARPGGNVTGFTNFEPSIGSKWLGLLKEVAPKLARSATMFHPDEAPHAPYLLRSIETASQTLDITTIAAPLSLASCRYNSRPNTNSSSI